jgi:hypothetical protein
MLVVRDARAAGREGPGSHPAACPGVATTWCTLHFELPPRVAVRAQTDSGRWSQPRDATSESLWPRESRCLLVIIGGGITSLVRQRLSAEHPGSTEETAG